jgi:hypothetical protein
MRERAVQNSLKLAGKFTRVLTQTREKLHQRLRHDREGEEEEEEQ